MLMENSATSVEPAEGAALQIKRLYVKEQACKLPNAQHVFREEWKPEMELELHIDHTAVSSLEYEVVLRIRLTARLKQLTALTLEVQQAGLFELKNYTPEQLTYLLKSYCPTLLFPFARQVVANHIAEAGLPPLLLAPINFDALYHQQQKASENPSATESVQTERAASTITMQ